MRLIDVNNDPGVREGKMEAKVTILNFFVLMNLLTLLNSRMDKDLQLFLWGGEKYRE